MGVRDGEREEGGFAPCLYVAQEVGGESDRADGEGEAAVGSVEAEAVDVEGTEGTERESVWVVEGGADVAGSSVAQAAGGGQVCCCSQSQCCCHVHGPRHEPPYPHHANFNQLQPTSTNFNQLQPTSTNFNGRGECQAAKAAGKLPLKLVL